MPSFLHSQGTPQVPDPPANKYKAKDVQLYSNPWVSGTRAAAYFGPVSISCKFRYSWNYTIENSISRLQVEAATLGANSIVGVEMAIDPFAKPPIITIIGTAAVLEPMF